MIRTRLFPLLVFVPVLALAAQAPKPSDTLPPARIPISATPSRSRAGWRSIACAAATATASTRAAIAGPI